MLRWRVVCYVMIKQKYWEEIMRIASKEEGSQGEEDEALIGCMTEERDAVVIDLLCDDQGEALWGEHVDGMGRRGQKNKWEWWVGYQTRNK